jgi:hypothetical protein
MNETIVFFVGIGVLVTLVYCLMGIGVARAVSKMKGEDFPMVIAILWPIALAVIAWYGDVDSG